MDPAYLAGYKELYDNHWWWRAREAVVLGEIHRRWPNGGAGRILDVGCGDGLLFSRLEAVGEPYGVELEPAAVSAANPHRDRIHIGPFESFASREPFGLLLMLDVLEHLDAPEAAATSAYDLLRPGGTLLVTVPAFRALWTRHDELNEHRVRYDRASLTRLLRDAGFTPETARYFFHWVAAAKLVVRAVELIRRSAPEPPRTPPTLVNRTLLGLSRIEAKLARGRLPFGSSLMVVARRPP